MASRRWLPPPPRAFCNAPLEKRHMRLKSETMAKLMVLPQKTVHIFKMMFIYATLGRYSDAIFALCVEPKTPLSRLTFCEIDIVPPKDVIMSVSSRAESVV